MDAAIDRQSTSVSGGGAGAGSGVVTSSSHHSANAHLAPQILQGLRARSKHLVPTGAWLARFLATQRAGLPVNALVSTAGFRLLTADIKTALEPGATVAFPSNIVDVEVKDSGKLAGPVIVQVLDVEDMSRSRWSQVEELEAEERGEKTKGREIIRVTAAPTTNTTTAVSGEGDAGADTNTDVHGDQSTGGKAGSQGPHKLLVEDVKGTKVYAIEMTKIVGVGLGMTIGSKMLLRDVTVARGVLLLRASNVTFLGGKIDSLQQHWKANRKSRLQAGIQQAQANA